MADEKTFDQIGDLMQQAIAETIADFIDSGEVSFVLQQKILEGCRDGVTIDGEAMKPYSDKWAKIRTAAGRSIISDFLRFGGSLLNSMSVIKKDKNSFTIGFRGQHKEYNYNKGKKKKKSDNKEDPISNAELAQYLHQDRPFFGASDEAKQMIINIFMRLLSEKLEK